MTDKEAHKAINDYMIKVLVPVLSSHMFPIVKQTLLPPECAR